MLDRDAVCCESGKLDACGACDGTGLLVDAQNVYALFPTQALASTYVWLCAWAATLMHSCLMLLACGIPMSSHCAAASRNLAAWHPHEIEADCGSSLQHAVVSHVTTCCEYQACMSATQYANENSDQA